ncbi:MAG: HalOD1 output domain-containing protein [Halalkalicoccus sp.]
MLVVEAVATVSGSSAAEIGPINDVLDPEALCELFAPKGNGHDREGGVVSFRLEGCHVEIDGTEREVLVYE